jgi:hypothetical protein
LQQLWILKQTPRSLGDAGDAILINIDIICIVIGHTLTAPTGTFLTDITGITPTVTTDTIHIDTTDTIHIDTDRTDTTHTGIITTVHTTTEARADQNGPEHTITMIATATAMPASAGSVRQCPGATGPVNGKMGVGLSMLATVPARHRLQPTRTIRTGIITTVHTTIEAHANQNGPEHTITMIATATAMPASEENVLQSRVDSGMGNGETGVAGATLATVLVRRELPLTTPTGTITTVHTTTEAHANQNGPEHTITMIATATAMPASAGSVRQCLGATGPVNGKMGVGLSMLATVPVQPRLLHMCLAKSVLEMVSGLASTRMKSVNWGETERTVSSATAHASEGTTVGNGKTRATGTSGDIVTASLAIPLCGRR